MSFLDLLKVRCKRKNIFLKFWSIKSKHKEYFTLNKNIKNLNHMQILGKNIRTQILNGYFDMRFHLMIPNHEIKSKILQKPWFWEFHIIISPFSNTNIDPQVYIWYKGKHHFISTKLFISECKRLICSCYYYSWYW